MDTLFPIRVALAERQAKQLESLPVVVSPKVMLRGIQVKSSDKIQITPVDTPKIQKKNLIDEVITEEIDVDDDNDNNDDDMITRIFDKEILSSKTFEKDKISKEIFENEEKEKSEDLELIIPTQTSEILELGTKEESDTDIVPSSPDLIPKIRSRHASHSSRNEAVSTLPQTHGHSHNHAHIHTNGHVSGADGHPGLALNASSLHRDSLHRQGSTRRNHEKVASVLARLSERSHSLPGSRNSTLTNDHISVLPDGHANPDLSFSHVIPDPHNPSRRSKNHRNPFTGTLEHRSPSMPIHGNSSHINHEPDLLMTTLPRVPGGSRHSTLSRHNSMGRRSHHSQHNDTEQDYYIHASRARYKDEARKQRFNLQTVMLIGCYTMLFVVAIIVGVVLCQQNGWLGFGGHNSKSSSPDPRADGTRGRGPDLDYPELLGNRPVDNRLPPDTTRFAVAGVGNVQRNPTQRPPAMDGRPLRPGNNNGFTNSGPSDFPGQLRPGNSNGFANTGPSDFDSTNSGKSFDPLRAFNDFDFDSNNNQGFANNNLGVDNPIRGNNQGRRNNLGANNNQDNNNNNNQGINLLDLVENNPGVNFLDLFSDSGSGNSFNNPSNANNRGGRPNFDSSDTDNRQGGFGTRNNQRNLNNGNLGNSGTSFNDNSGFTGNRADSNSQFENQGNNAGTGTGGNRNNQGRGNQGQIDNFGVGNNQGNSAVGNNQNNRNTNNPGNENRNNQGNQNRNNQGNQNRNNQGNQNRNNQGSQNENNQRFQNINDQGSQNRNNQGSFGNDGQGRNQGNGNNNQRGFDNTGSRNNNSPIDNQSSFGNIGSSGNTGNQAQINANTVNQALDNLNLNIDAGFVKSQGVSNAQNPFGNTGRRNNQGTPSTSSNQNGHLKNINSNNFNQNINRNSGGNFQNAPGGSSQSSSRAPARNNAAGSNSNQGSALSNVNRQNSGGNRQSIPGFSSNNGVPATNPVNNIQNNNRQNFGQNPQINQNPNQANRGSNGDMISAIRSNLPGPIHPPGIKGENWNSHPSGNAGENWNSNKGSQLQHSGNSRQAAGRSLQNSNANINAGTFSRSNNRKAPPGNGTVNHSIIGELLTHPNVFGGGISVQHGNLMSQSTISMLDGDVIPAILRPTPDIVVHINPESVGAGVTLKSTKTITERTTPSSVIRVQNNRKSQATITPNSPKSIFVNRNQNNRPILQSTSRSGATPRPSIGIPLPPITQRTPPQNQGRNISPASSPINIGIPLPSPTQVKNIAGANSPVRGASSNTGIPIPSQNQVQRTPQVTSPARGTSGSIGIPIPSQSQGQTNSQPTSVSGASQNIGLPPPTQNQNTAAVVNQSSSRSQHNPNRKVVRTWTHTDTEGTYSQGQVRSDGSFLFTNCKPVGSCIS